MSGFFSSEPINTQSLFEFKALSESTKFTLSKVYASLALLTGFCALGSLGNIFMGIGGKFSGLVSFICLLSFIGTDQKSQWRLPILSAFAFLNGLSLGPLIQMAVILDPSILITALFATFGIFVSFSLCALWSDKRQFLYLGGILGTTSLFIFICSLLGLLGIASNFMFNVQLYVGLLVFCGYVIYDTQVIVYKIERGNKDHLMHSLNLFTDLVAIFVRLLIILMKNSGKKKERE